MKRIIVALLLLGLFTATSFAAVLYEDNFDYNTTTHTTLSAVNSGWSVTWGQGWTGSDVKVLATTDARFNKAYFSYNYAYDRDFHWALTNVSENNYTIKTDVYNWYTTQDNTLASYIAGRVSNDQYIRFGFVWATDNQLYLRMADSAGNALGDYWFATMAQGEAIQLQLTINGSEVTGIASHNGSSYTLTMQTSVVSTGQVGFGGNIPYTYGSALFDNFSVESIPEPTTLAIFGAGLLGLTRKRK